MLQNGSGKPRRSRPETRRRYPRLPIPKHTHSSDCLGLFGRVRFAAFSALSFAPSSFTVIGFIVAMRRWEAAQDHRRSSSSPADGAAELRRSVQRRVIGVIHQWPVLKQRILEERQNPMPCRICVQLEEALAKTQWPDSPELLLGLTEAGMRNHTHQRRGRALKAETDLTKHKTACSKRDRGSDPAF